jgi:hypothetical protein
LNWRSGKIQIMVATNAFGMGINVPDVRIVIHAGLPMSINKLKKTNSIKNNAKICIFYRKFSARKWACRL